MRNQNPTLRNQYLDSLFPIQNSTMLKAKEAAANLGMAGISVSVHELEIIKWAVKVCQVRKMVEIGTLTGFSGLGLLEILPSDGILWTFEKDENRSQQAQILFEEALASSPQKQVILKRGDAKIELETIIEQGPFDAIFIDGNKSAYVDYLSWAERNLKKGGLLLADNVFLGGAVYSQSGDNTSNEAGPRFSAKQISVMKTFNSKLCDPALFRTCIAPTTEGLLLAIKLF